MNDTSFQSRTQQLWAQVLPLTPQCPRARPPLPPSHYHMCELGPVPALSTPLSKMLCPSMVTWWALQGRVTVAISAADRSTTVIIMIIGQGPPQSGSPFLGRQTWGKEAALCGTLTGWSRDPKQVLGDLSPEPRAPASLPAKSGKQCLRCRIVVGTKRDNSVWQATGAQ